MRIDWLPLVLQTSDPLFPTGAYAHSLGLEELVRMGVVTDEGTLAAYLHEQILPMLERMELPYLRLLREAAVAGDLEELTALDRELSAVKVAGEARAASCQIGRRRLHMLREIVPGPLLEEMSRRVREGRMEGHHLTVFAAQMKDAPLEAALAVWLYLAAAGAGSAALKLIRIGQEGCQRVLRDVLAAAPGAIERSRAVAREEIGCFSPLLDLAGMRHAVANERLFIS